MAVMNFPAARVVARSSATVPTAAVTGVGKIAAKPVTRAEWFYYAIAYAVLIAGAVIGIVSARHWHTNGSNQNTFIPGAGVTIFAALYVVTQALERLLEPVAALYGRTPAPSDADIESTAIRAVDIAPDSRTKLISKAFATRKRNAAIADAEMKSASNAPDAQIAADRAATWQQLVDQVASNTATLWAVASGFGMVISGATGLFLLHAIDSGKWDLPRWVDVIATGLIIGGGTKPLHDLISNIQKAKDQRAAPEQASTSSAAGTG